MDVQRFLIGFGLLVLASGRASFVAVSRS